MFRIANILSCKIINKKKWKLQLYKYDYVLVTNSYYNKKVRELEDPKKASKLNYVFQKNVKYVRITQ